MSEGTATTEGLIARLVAPFLRPQPPILLIIFALTLGLAALFLTPREEEPQIVVPLADVIVQAPGASAERGRKVRLDAPRESCSGRPTAWSTSIPCRVDDIAIVTVRFHVGQNVIQSLVRLHNNITHEHRAGPARRHGDG
jgi:multidrug efflux pump subunit AcrB